MFTKILSAQVTDLRIYDFYEEQQLYSSYYAYCVAKILKFPEVLSLVEEV